MATASSNRLDQWLTQAYGIIGDIQSIATDTAGATAKPNAAPAAETTPPNTWWTQSSTYSDPFWTSSADPWASSSAATQTTSAPSSKTPTSAARTTSARSSPSRTSAQQSSTKVSGTVTPTTSADPSNTSAASAATSSGAAISKDLKGGSNNLPIILGVVLGLLALICIILGAWFFLRRRRRRRSTAPVLDDEDDGTTWRRDGAAHEPMMGTTATAWAGAGAGAKAARAGADTSYSAHPPQMTQHPAYRGLETGSTNPFVPPVPAPRRAIQTPSPVLAKETSPIGPEPPVSADTVITNNQNLTNSAAAVPTSPTETSPVHTRNPFTTGITALAAGVAANKIRRKPVNSHASSDYSSPTDETATNGWNRPAEDGRPAYGHTRNPSNQPLMSGGQPTNYTDERPPTPLGFMGFIKNATAARVAAANQDPPHDEESAQHADLTNSPDHPSSLNRPSYQSFTMRPGPNHYADQFDPNVDSAATTRNGRRVSFNEPLEATTTPGSYRSNRRSSSAIGFTDYDYPLPTTHRTDSPNGSFGSGGSGSPNRYPHRYSNGSNGSGNGSPNRHSPLPSQMANAREKRLRLSDLRAREEELERLREMDEADNVHGWRGREQYGYDPRLRQNGNGYANGRRGGGGGDVGMAM